MRNLLNKQLKNEKGLTLIELLAVIVILAIIAAIAIPAIGNIISNSKSKAILSDATQVISSAKTAIADGECGDASATVVTCEKSNLEDLVEGIELGKDDKVVKSGTEYSIYYAEFANLNDKYSDKLVSKAEKGGITAETEIKATDLAKAMGK